MQGRRGAHPTVAPPRVRQSMPGGGLARILAAARAEVWRSLAAAAAASLAPSCASYDASAVVRNRGELTDDGAVAQRERKLVPQQVEPSPLGPEYDAAARRRAAKSGSRPPAPPQQVPHPARSSATAF
jgi:hypothetical protein